MKFANRKRFLTRREANRCEQAEESVCKCRCGGLKHGAKRVGAGALSSLPMDDPHYVPDYSKADVERILRHAREKMRMPVVDGREEDFSRWTEASEAEWKAFHEAQKLIGDALWKVKQDGL